MTKRRGKSAQSRARSDRDTSVGRRHPRGLLVVLVVATAVAAVSYLRGNFDRRQVQTTGTSKSYGAQADPEARGSLSEDAASAGSNSAMDVLPARQLRTRRAEENQILDPRRDGWGTEAFAAAADHQLKRLGRMIRGNSPAAPDDHSRLADQSFTCAALRPEPLATVYDRSGILVRRFDPRQNVATPGGFRGPDGLAQAIEQLRDGLGEARDVEVHFKLFRVSPADTVTTVTVYYEASGQLPRGSVQQNATWDVEFTLPQDDARPAMTSIRVRRFEEVTARRAGGTLLADCTEAVAAATAAYREQIQYGANYWMQHLADHVSPGLLESLNGIAVGDVNGDLLEDVYICQPAGLPNRLWIQQPDGTVSDHSAVAGVDVMDLTHAALILDLDNDGDGDLAVLSTELLIIFSNDGQGVFSVEAEIAGQHFRCLTASDADHDGDLDLYVCSYGSSSNNLAQYTRPNSYFHATNGGRNVLLRNDGNWTFTDTTGPWGLDDNNDRWSYASAWEDYDNDGDSDLYVANDFGRNNLYRNDGGRFTDVAEQAGAEDANFGMSVSWADYNRDGLMDIYVGNMFSAAGNRITFQEHFRPDSSRDVRLAYQQLARGNTLLQNNGDGTFRDVSEEKGVTVGKWSWGSVFMDINNDGWDDLLVGNGYITQRRADDL